MPEEMGGEGLPKRRDEKREQDPLTGGVPEHLKPKGSLAEKARFRTVGAGIGKPNPGDSVAEIRRYVDNRMRALETTFASPHKENLVVQEVEKLLQEASTGEYHPQAADKVELKKYRLLMETKIKALRFFHSVWRSGDLEKDEAGATGKGIHEIAPKSSVVDDGQFFSRLLGDAEIAEEFGKLVDTAYDRHQDYPELRVRTRFSWNEKQAELAEKFRDDDYGAQESAEYYAWMLWDIACMHAEADDLSMPEGVEFPFYAGAKGPKLAYPEDQLSLKKTSVFFGWLGWEPTTLINEQWREFWYRPALRYRTQGVDPENPAAATSPNRSLLPNADSFLEGKPARHGDMFRVSNYLCYHKFS